MATASPRAPERFRSLLYEAGGTTTDGVIRMDVLRRAPLLGSYHHSDRTLTAGLALHGPFYQVPDWLYFRRDHAERAERAFKTVRTGAPTWTRAGPTRCATRPSACTPSTSGATSARSGGLR